MCGSQCSHALCVLQELKKKDPKYTGAGKSANALLGDYENTWKASEEEEVAGENEQGQKVLSGAQILKNVRKLSPPNTRMDSGACETYPVCRGCVNSFHALTPAPPADSRWR